MRDFNYYSPTEVVFGEDAELKVGELAKKHGGSRVIIVYGGNSAVKSGLLDRVTQSLKKEGIEVKAEGGVVPNPHLSRAREIIKSGIEFKADMIIGIGGGSAIDTAKMVAHGVANPDLDAWDFWLMKRPVEKTIPIGCVPTLPATGTETSDSSVITNDEVTPWQKRGLSTNMHRCKFTAMNPRLCMSLPQYQIGAGVADIFMHNAERFFTRVNGNHLSDQLAIGLFKDIMKYGPVVIDTPDDYEAMSEVMWCGTIAHNSITGLGAKGDTPREGDWSCHQLGHSLSSIYDSTHGASLTAVFPAWARFVCDADYKRFAQFGREVLGLEGDDEALCRETIEGIEDFFKSLKMPTNITELIGHTPSEKELEELAFHCSFEKTRTIGCFKALGYDEMLKVYTQAV